jgi:hypothetical protein
LPKTWGDVHDGRAIILSTPGCRTEPRWDSQTHLSDPFPKYSKSRPSTSAAALGFGWKEARPEGGRRTVWLPGVVVQTFQLARMVRRTMRAFGSGASFQLARMVWRTMPAFGRGASTDASWLESSEWSESGLRAKKDFYRSCRSSQISSHSIRGFPLVTPGYVLWPLRGPQM